MDKIQFDEFLSLNGLSIKVIKVNEYKEEDEYTVEVYHGNHLLADGNCHYVKHNKEFKMDYGWLYDYICELPGSYEWNEYVGKDKVIKRTDGTLEASVIIEDIKQLGMPNIMFYADGCSIDLYPDTYELAEFDIIFNYQGKKVVRISPWTRVISTNHPANIISGIKKAYVVMEGTFKNSGVYVLWPEK